MEAKIEDRRVKVTPGEILNDLFGSEPLTAQYLADKHDVKKPTICNKIRELRKENHPIIHGENGYILISKEWLQNEDNAKELNSFQNWIVATIKGLHFLSSPVRPLLPTMRKVLSENISKEERHQLMLSSAKITALLAMSEAEDEG